MIEPVQDGGAIGAQAREHKRRGCAHIGRRHASAREAWHATDEGGAPLDMDTRAHPAQLVDMPEALLEDRLGHRAGAGGGGQQRHCRRLEVGREAGIRARLDIHADKAAWCAAGHEAAFRR